MRMNCNCGSSPHTWGIRIQARPCDPCYRFIPTYVGHTITTPFRWVVSWVHPHIRGAYSFEPRPDVSDPGSSPHTWGIRYRERLAVDRIRFIPTYVGHTELRERPETRIAVHPHIRGAYASSFLIMVSVIGSSPHTWGIPLSRYLSSVCKSVHPHIRGAYTGPP